MKLLRYAVALMFVCAMSGMAKADDFKLGVQDAGPGIDYKGTPLTNLKFGSCGAGFGKDYGCVTIENETGAQLTSFQLEFSAANITTTGACGSVSSYFITCSESMVGKDYLFTFSGGTGVPYDKNAWKEGEEGIEKWDPDDAMDTFTIVESGENRKDFGKMTLTPTPEPSSVLLMSTGLLLVGGFFVYKRRNGLDAMGL